MNFNAFQFDFSVLSIPDALHLAMKASTMEEMNQRIDIMDKCTVGGIKNLPATALPVFIEEFQQAYLDWNIKLDREYTEGGESE